MKKTYIKLFSALLAVVSFTSCGDFLDEVSQDEFKPETVEDYQEILNVYFCPCRAMCDRVCSFL